MICISCSNIVKECDCGSKGVGDCNPNTGACTCSEGYVDGETKCDKCETGYQKWKVPNDDEECK